MKPLHLDRDWLFQKYVVEVMSTYDIAKIVGRDPKRIYEKLIDFGIPTRPRGHNLTAGPGSDCYARGPDYVGTFTGRKHTEETKRKQSIAATRPKPHLRGKNNGMSGRTGALNPNYKDGSSPERQRLYASSEWKEFLRTIYKRDNYQCTRCGCKKIRRRWLHVHHVKAWAGNPGLRFDPANVVTLCRPCHEWVHSTSNTQRDYLA